MNNICGSGVIDVVFGGWFLLGVGGLENFWRLGVFC